MYLPTPTHKLGGDTKSISKRSLTVLKSVFFLTQIGCLTKAKEPRLHDFIPIAKGRISGCISFLRVLVCYVKCKQPRPEFEHWSPKPFSTTITIAPRVPPNISIYSRLLFSCHHNPITFSNLAYLSETNSQKEVNFSRHYWYQLYFNMAFEFLNSFCIKTEMQLVGGVFDTDKHRWFKWTIKQEKT